MTAEFFESPRAAATYLTLHRLLTSLGYAPVQPHQPIASEPPSRLEQWSATDKDLIVLTVNTGDWSVLTSVASNRNLWHQFKAISDFSNRPSDDAPF